MNNCLKIYHFVVHLLNYLIELKLTLLKLNNITMLQKINLLYKY